MRGSKVGAWAVAAACVAVATPVLLAGPATADNKVTICHRTHSTTNPYRRITVGISAVNGSGGNDHTHHWGTLFDPGYAYPPNAKVWGDIIPVGNGGQTGVNWTAAGQATFTARCGAMTPQDFYNTEREAGVEKSVILADLLEQGAEGDPTTFTTMTYTGSVGGVTDTTPAPVITTVTDPVTNPQVTPSPSPTPTPSAAPSGSSPPSPAASPSPSPSDSPSPSPSPSTSPSTAPSPSPSTAPSPSPSTAPSAPSSPTPALTPSAIPTPAVTSVPDPVIEQPAAVPTSPAPSPVSGAEPQPLPTPAAPTPAAPTPASPGGQLLSPAPDGTVAGIAWFDRNDNGSLDPREWLLPAVPVTLTPVADPQSPLLLRARAVRAQATTYTRTTTSDGSYRFTGLPPGAYRVTAVLQEAGFAYTSDTDGLADWRVGVDVTTRGPAVADFAGLGTGRLTGQVLDTVERRPVASADVRCTWAGFDDVFGTADDVVMTDVANTQGGYDWSGVPYGAFTCVGKDPVRGTVSAAATVRVVSALPVHATLPLGIRSAVASRSGFTAALPRTGLSADALATIAGWLIVLGVVALWRGRDRSNR